MTPLNNTYPNNYVFQCSYIPNTDYSITECSLPSVNLGTTRVPTGPAQDSIVPFPGTTIDYDPLLLNFIVDKDFNNYFEIFNWMKRCQGANDETLKTMVTEGCLTVLSNSKNPIFKFIFKGMFPIMLGSIEFSSQNTENTISVSVQFAIAEFNRG